MFLCHSSQSIFLLNLVLFCLLFVNIYLRSLKINISLSMMVAKSFNSCIDLCYSIITICVSIISILITQVLLKSGDIEIDSGPKKSSAIKFYHSNLNGLATHDFVKVSLLDVFITAHNFDIVYLRETVLDSTIPHNDENININGYSSLRVDHLNNVRRDLHVF